MEIEFKPGPDLDRFVIVGTNVTHREDGPAAIFKNGTKIWMYHGLKHREDGPAVTYHTGDTAWWKHGKLHSLVGPAVIIRGRPEYNEYWIEGIKHTEESYKLILFTLYNKKVND